MDFFSKKKLTCFFSRQDILFVSCFFCFSALCFYFYISFLLIIFLFVLFRVLLFPVDWEQWVIVIQNFEKMGFWIIFDLIWNIEFFPRKSKKIWQMPIFNFWFFFVEQNFWFLKQWKKYWSIFFPGPKIIFFSFLVVQKNFVFDSLLLLFNRPFSSWKNIWRTSISDHIWLRAERMISSYYAPQEKKVKNFCHFFLGQKYFWDCLKKRKIWSSSPGFYSIWKKSDSLGESDCFLGQVYYLFCQSIQFGTKSF